MKKLYYLFLAAFLMVSFSVNGQDEAPKEEVPTWLVGGGIGLNIDQLLIIQPRAGAGENKIGFGGLGNIFATYQKDRLTWDNIGSLQLVFQRLGRVSVFNPFQKTIDDLRLGSKVGYSLTADKKWYAALEFTFQSQLLNTFNGNTLTDVNNGEALPDDNLSAISQFFSPATITITPGIDWKPNANFSVLFSPASIRMIVVANDAIAGLYIDADGSIIDPVLNPLGGNGFQSSLHGNPMRAPGDFDNADFQLGASARATYKNKFVEDRLSFTSSLFLFYDYLGGQDGATNNPVVEWTTETAFDIYKGLSLALNTGLFYDFNKPVSKDWNRDLGVYETVEPGAMFTQALLIKYNFIFGDKKK
ncbi:MAG: DUF3078 domain-containing protein [Bacteroidota bacterium]